MEKCTVCKNYFPDEAGVYPLNAGFQCDGCFVTGGGNLSEFERNTITSIKWLKVGQSGLCAGATYKVEMQSDGFLFVTDDFGRPQSVHTRYLNILYAEVSHAA